MRAEEIMKALGGADAAYVEHALERPAPAARRTLRPLLRLGLAAALIALLAGTAFAVMSGLATKEKERESSPQWYELYFEDNPAAEDAPDQIVDHYFPAGTPKGYREVAARLKYVDGRVVRADGEWRCDALRIGSEEEGDGVIPATAEFHYMPLRCLNVHDNFQNENVFGDFFNVEPGQFTKSVEELDGREYLRYDCQSGVNGYFTQTSWYFWVDEARHYVFTMMFNEPVPREDRIAFLRAVAPLGKNDWNELMHGDRVAAWNERLEAWNAAHPEAEPLPLIRLYLPTLRPEGYDAIQQNYCARPSDALAELPMDEWLPARERGEVYVNVDEMLDVRLFRNINDGTGRSLGCSRYLSISADGRSARERLELAAQTEAADQCCTVDRFSLDGQEIVRARHTVDEGESGTAHYESWILIAPDDSSLLELMFTWYGEPISEELKIAWFRSIEEVDSGSLTEGYILQGW